MHSDPMLRVESLSYQIDRNTPIFSDISFCIEQGEFVVVTGRNGSGKSMLLKCIKGVLQPTDGSVFLNGEDLSKEPRKRNRQVGMVFQDADSQIVGQTVERDIAFGLENLGIKEPLFSQRMDAVVQLMDLNSLLRQRPRTLSGGEKRRVSIAGVLVMDPTLLILDEPFANLDYPGVVQVLEALVHLHEQGHTIIVVSHEIEKVLAHADKLLLMDNGSLIANDTPAKVLGLLEEHGVRVPTHLTIEEMTWLKQ